MNRSGQALKISVVTPSFNQAAYLEATIRSVLNQTYPHVEYIVMDGGSSDRSVDIIRQYSERIAIWRSEKDQGQADAIARGFELATGDILCWVNSDDVLFPDACAHVARFFDTHPSEEVVNGAAIMIDEHGGFLPGRFCNLTLGQNASYNLFRFYSQDGVYQPATFWRRAAYDAVGGIDRSLQLIMDLDLFARLSARRPFASIPSFLAGFRCHGESKTATQKVVRDRELAAFHARHHVSDSSPLLRASFYCWFRSRSLLRRLGVLFAAKSGAVKIPSELKP